MLNNNLVYLVIVYNYSWSQNTLNMKFGEIWQAEITKLCDFFISSAEPKHNILRKIKL